MSSPLLTLGQCVRLQTLGRCRVDVVGVVIWLEFGLWTAPPIGMPAKTHGIWRSLDDWRDVRVAGPGRRRFARTHGIIVRVEARDHRNRKHMLFRLPVFYAPHLEQIKEHTDAPASPVLR